jgi:hypothetical protein
MISIQSLSAKQYKGQRPISLYKRNGDKSFTFSLKRMFEIFYFYSFVPLMIMNTKTIKTLSKERFNGSIL